MDIITPLLISALTAIESPDIPLNTEHSVTAAVHPVAEKTLVIIGEGGPAYGMFVKAAHTFAKEHEAELIEVHDGAQMVQAMRHFVREHGRMKRFHFFGHGNNVGLYVNQEPGVNGALYANDPSLNTPFRADSIYGLARDLFAEDGIAVFHGCNIAEGYTDAKDTFAEYFANHFQVTVRAALGPTEFSQSPHEIDPFTNASMLPADFSGDVYMVPTDPNKGFVTITPQSETVGGYTDVPINMQYSNAIRQLRKRGLSVAGNDRSFHPYRSITEQDARAFCIAAVDNKEKCRLDEYAFSRTERIRNLHALKMLMQAYDINIPHSLSNHAPLVAWAHKEGVLTDDFMMRRWFTRAEMAQLTMNFIEKFDDGQRFLSLEDLRIENR